MTLLNLAWTTSFRLCGTCVGLIFLFLCTFSHFLTLNPKTVPQWFGTHSQHVSIFWLLSSNHFTDFNPLRTLVLEGSPRKQTHWQNSSSDPTKCVLFILDVVGDRVLLPTPGCPATCWCSPGWTFHLFHPYCLDFFRFRDDFLRLQTIALLFYHEYVTTISDSQVLARQRCCRFLK